MATKLMVPRPKLTPVKVQPQEIDDDHTEPSGPPVDVIELAEIIEVVEVARAQLPKAVVLPGILIGPPPVHVAAYVGAREPAFSLPSQYEIDSERKSSPPVAMRRKELTKYVASAVGVAWFICTCAIGETALRSLIASMH